MNGLPLTSLPTATDGQSMLQRWRLAGWLRPLDVALAGFIQELDAQAPPSLLLATALLAHLEGRGHSCLPLAEFRSDPLTPLAWPAAAAAELTAAVQELPVDAAAARDAWRRSAVVECDPGDDCGSSPLVLADDRLYLRRYWRHETTLSAQVLSRSNSSSLPLHGTPPIDTARARALLDSLFDGVSQTQTPGPAAPNWQKVACALALRGRLAILSGGPGTGKTYTAARLLVLLQALHDRSQPLRVSLAAPTGKAASRLRQSIAQALATLRQQMGERWPSGDWAAHLPPATTLHALLGARPGTRRLRHDASHPLPVDVLFVDEASMVHLEMMSALLEALPANARLVLLGDKDQLASVEAGAVLGDLCRGGGYTPQTATWVQALTGQAVPDADLGPGDAVAQHTVTLRLSRRFAGPIGQLAQAVHQGSVERALAALQGAPAGEVLLMQSLEAAAVPALALDGRGAAAAGYRAYAARLAERPAESENFEAWVASLLARFDGFRVLCAVREGSWGVAGLNDAIERALAAAGGLDPRGDWYEGRPVMVTRNDAALGVFNGDIGLVLRPPGGGSLRAYFGDAAGLRSVSTGRLADVETAFAMTVHKSQGSEFDHVMLVLPDEDSPGLTRELVYTGITRARTACTLVMKNAAVLGAAIARQTRRLSGLRTALDAGASTQPGAKPHA